MDGHRRRQVDVMKVLITGAGGRIGSRLTRSLLSEGHQVRAFGLDTDPQLERFASQGIEVVTGDLEVPSSLRGIAHGVDAVCHLAAALTTHDVSDDRFVDVNLRGTFNLLEVVRAEAPDLRRFIYTSSDAVYWSGGVTGSTYLPVDEAHPRTPGSVYGATKVGAEELCRAYWHSYGIPSAVMRPTATAEPAELVEPSSVFARRWFVASAVRWFESRPRLTQGEEELLGRLREIDDGRPRLYSLVAPDGTSSLSMIGHAEDAAQGMRAMLEPTEAIGEAFNIGPASPHADRQLVEALGAALGIEVTEIRSSVTRPSWYISSAKARGVLGYQPRWTVFDMVEHVVEQKGSAG